MSINVSKRYKECTIGGGYKMVRQVRIIESCGIIQSYGYNSCDWEAVYGPAAPDLCQPRRESNQAMIDHHWALFAGCNADSLGLWKPLNASRPLTHTQKQG